MAALEKKEKKNHNIVDLVTPSSINHATPPFRNLCRIHRPRGFHTIGAVGDLEPKLPNKDSGGTR